MADDGIEYRWMPSRKAGVISRVSTRFSLSGENKQADGRQDGQTCFTRPNYQVRTGAEKILSPRLADHEQDWQILPG